MNLRMPAFARYIALSWRYRKGIVNPVLVYQMGKVGSKSITQSVNDLPGFDAFNVHRLCPENIRRVDAGHAFLGRQLTDDTLGLFLRRKLFSNPQDRIRIISVVREPVSRNVSAYFENLKSIEKNDHVHVTLGIEELTKNFLMNYPHETPLHWFEKELESTTGIDIYSYPFDTTTGHVRIVSGPFDVLVIRSELDNDQKSELIAGFLGISEFKISNHNISGSKAYGKTYRQFVESALLPQTYISRMLESQYACHFYTESERKQAAERWLR